MYYWSLTLRSFRANPKLIEDDANGFVKALYQFSHLWILDLLSKNQILAHAQKRDCVPLNLGVLNLDRITYNFKTLVKERKKKLSESFLRRGIMCTWNATAGCQMNQKEAKCLSVTWQTCFRRLLIILFLTILRILKRFLNFWLFQFFPGTRFLATPLLCLVTLHNQTVAKWEVGESKLTRMNNAIKECAWSISKKFCRKRSN